MTEQKADITEQNRALIAKMEEALAENGDNMGDFFAQDFCWKGNFGCGEKKGLAHFRTGWQLPFRKAFTDRKYITKSQFGEGEWVAAFGHIDALHSGEFMGIKATNKRVTIRFMDIWHIKDGKITNNWVNVDFPYLLQQLGKDVFDSKGWENAYEAEHTAQV